ncbi:MAG: LPS-assembly protein LptD [Chitinophagales bacterium]|nr:LPS-assembly protein LptD [Chitinophagales bacterium]
MKLRVNLSAKVQSYCCLMVFWAAIFTFVCNTASAQEHKLNFNTIIEDDDSTLNTLIQEDSLITRMDSLTADSAAAYSAASKLSLEERLGIKISPDALPSPVTSAATDSAVLDMKGNVFLLYGDANVKYEDMELKAGKIEYSQSKNMVTAVPLSDTAVKMKDRPMFTQGSEKFTYDSLKYNFKSKRAIVLNPRTQYGEGYVFSKQVKRNPDQSIYGLHNVYTTCALDTPHFGINAKKIKVIPNRVVASGPANIAIEQVPTPVFLPFGLFPVSKGQRSGFLLPTYTIEEQRGVGLMNGGYYFYLGKYVDLETRANIFSKGSWQTSARSSYANRYKYNGAFVFTYAYNKTGEEYEIGSQTQKEFNVQWRHNSDDKSRPNSKFSASVNAGSSSFNANNTYDAQQILNNQYNSNITYTKSWANKPYQFSIGARHSQEASTGRVDITLPEMSFFVSQFNPFQGKNSVGTKWYEKITTSYTLTAQNQLVFTDSLFSIDRLNISDFNNAVKHSIPISASYNVLRFINLTIGGNYNEYWYSKQTFRAYDYTGDTVANYINRGFYAARDYNASISANTRIYGLKMFKKGSAIMGIRHVLTPNVSLNYVPDFAKAPYNFGYQTILDPKSETPQYLSPYQGSLLGAPSQLGNYSSVVGFGLDNNLQLKVRSNNAKDSSGSKNVSIIDRLALTSGYNLAADSFNWQNLSMTFATRFFDVINMTANATFDPYVFDYEEGRRINTTMFGRGTGIARFQNFGVTLGGSLRAKQRDDNNPARQSDQFNRLMQYGYSNDYVDFNVPWNMTLTYALQISKTYLSTSKKDTVQISSHNVGINGDVNLTPRWKLVVGTSFNIVEKKLQMTQIDIYRDLHCWEMRLTAVPFGDRKFYSFTLNVKAQVLQDLKLLRRRDYRDAVN